MAEIDLELPGAELIVKGLADQATGVTSVESTLLEIGAPRLRGLGIDVRESKDAVSPELRLYRLLGREHGNDAHSQYNALIRRLVSFEHALEFRRGRARRSGE